MNLYRIHMMKKNVEFSLLLPTEKYIDDAYLIGLKIASDRDAKLTKIIELKNDIVEKKMSKGKYNWENR